MLPPAQGAGASAMDTDEAGAPEAAQPMDTEGGKAGDVDMAGDAAAEETGSSSRCGESLPPKHELMF